MFAEHQASPLLDALFISLTPAICEHVDSSSVLCTHDQRRLASHATIDGPTRTDIVLLLVLHF